VDRPHLTRLLRAAGKPVFYNRHAFQKENPNVATCGRHAAVRLLYAPYSLAQYKKVLDSAGMAPDDFVSGVTYERLRK
jgi:hypothetical protein